MRLDYVYQESRRSRKALELMGLEEASQGRDALVWAKVLTEGMAEEVASLGPGES